MDGWIDLKGNLDIKEREEAYRRRKAKEEVRIHGWVHGWVDG